MLTLNRLLAFGFRGLDRRTESHIHCTAPWHDPIIHTGYHNSHFSVKLVHVVVSLSLSNYRLGGWFDARHDSPIAKEHLLH